MPANRQVASRLEHALFAPIGGEGRAEIVTRRLTAAILGGHLPAGRRLPAELELARRFGVATVTVREALDSLRSRGLIRTFRGRQGGSFVAEGTDPLAFGEASLAASSRGILRDLATHYAVVTGAAVALAARHAAPEDLVAPRARLDTLDENDCVLWRRTIDDILAEVVALGDSPRIVRDQLELQTELSPYLRVLDEDRALRRLQRARYEEILSAVRGRHPAAARAASDRLVDALLAALLHRLDTSAAPDGPPAWALANATENASARME